MREKLSRFFLLIGVVFLVVSSYPALAEEVTLNLIGQKAPPGMFYLPAFSEEAPPGVKVKADFMTWDAAVTKMKITLSAGSSAYDMLITNSGYILDFASKGWLMPLNEYIQKYEDEFHFSDIPQSLWDGVTYQGKIYGFPMAASSMLYFYRGDLLKQAGLQPATTLEEYVDLAAKLTTSQRYGTSLELKPVDSLGNSFHSYLNAVGGSWFDKENKPVFNGPEGVMALNYIKRLTKYAPPGVLGYANDEGTVAMQQDKVAMLLMWISRAGPMDNAEVSRVVNRVKFAVPSSLWKGGPCASVMANDCFGISTFTKNDPDVIFRAIAQVTDKETMSSLSFPATPPRLSVANDPEIVAKIRYYPAGLATLQAGPFLRPTIPEFFETVEITMKRVAQALVGELEIKKALDLAARESYELLESRGYYK